MSVRSILCSLTAVLMSLMPLCAGAQGGSQFIVGQSIYNIDTTAPSVPTGLSATGISLSAISLSWNPSTDAVGVTGYEVFREGSFIATTSGTNYTDTGRASSTTYMYTVRAFDAAFNFSAQSATTSGTTLSPSPAADEDSDEDGNRPPSRFPPPRITVLTVTPGETEATIRFTTDQPTRATVSWGIREPGDLGSARLVVFQRTHETKITNLAPGTRYFLTITVENERGKTFTLLGQTFTTKPAPDTQDPFMPGYLTATAREASINLAWSNPNVSDFAAVRLVRSTRFYPRDPAEGEVVYDGQAEAFADTRVDTGVTYYYALFARDFAGNYSAGVIAQATVPRPGTIPVTPQDPFEDMPLATMTPPSVEKITLRDFEFVQHGLVLTLTDGAVPVEAEHTLTVRIAYDRVPEVLKTIAVTMQHPERTGETFTFILKVSRDKKWYEATIAPLQTGGRYQVGITVLDYKNQKYARLQGAVVAQIAALAGSSDGGFISYLLNQHWRRVLFVLLALVLIILLWYRRVQHAERRS
jgi:chitodextrinase